MNFADARAELEQFVCANLSGTAHAVNERRKELLAILDRLEAALAESASFAATHPARTYCRSCGREAWGGEDAKCDECREMEGMDYE